MTKRWRVLGSIALVLFLLFLSGRQIAYLWTEYLWFLEMNYGSVFVTQCLAKGAVGAVTWLVFVAVIYSNLMLARRLAGTGKLRATAAQALGEKVADLLERALGWIIFLIAAVIGGLVAGKAVGSWEVILKWLKAASFSASDPIFSKDIGFYVFVLPFYQLLHKYLVTALVVALVATVLIYLATAAIEVMRHRRHIATYVVEHLSVLAGLLILVKAWGYRLSMFGLLYGKAGNEKVWGAGFTDMNARYWALFLLMAAAIIAGLLLVAYPWLRRLKLPRVMRTVPAWGAVALVGVGLLAGRLMPFLVQKMFVEPTELGYERQYLQHNIELTRSAYALDRAEEIPFPAPAEITGEMLERNKDIVNNIRLWDARPQRDTYKQRQTLRPYYDFHDVDVDRYLFGSEYRQVTLAAREINYGRLPDPTWVNRVLQYTHGYGLCLSPVHEIDPKEKGMPKFYIKDIPPIVPDDVGLSGVAEVLTLNRPEESHAYEGGPEIYFGELTNSYVIAPTREPEFDYVGAEGDYHYDGSGGVPCASILRRLAFALRFNDWKILLTGSMVPESRILLNRHIVERAQRLAPFLLYDRDPYMVVVNGKLYWILDAYTVTDLYPYSEPFHDLQQKMDQSSQEKGKALKLPELFACWNRTTSQVESDPRQFNYIRNAVKVVVDAYSGRTEFYVADENDPLIKVYNRIFPVLFQPIEQMSAEFRAHTRYPVDMMQAQAIVYATYHMRHPETFYNKEDLWNIATEIYEDEIQYVEPYYVIMRLPDRSDTEFVLILPFTPAGEKKNMIAWLAARSDGDSYGTLLTFLFPKGTWVEGTQQVESRIDQDPEISKLLSLWNDPGGGSRVIRGNLLVIPIEDSLLYVEPLYLKAEASEFPQLQQVLAATQEKVVMADTLDGALQQLVGGGISIPPYLRLLIEDLVKHHERAGASWREDKMSDFGMYFEKQGNLIRRLEKETGRGNADSEANDK